MRIVTATITLVAATVLLGSPVLADDDKQARIAACNSYAQVITDERGPAASPRTEVTPTPSIPPPASGRVQAPGTGTSAAQDPLLEGMAPQGAGNSEYQQAFRNCMDKLKS